LLTEAPALKTVWEAKINALQQRVAAVANR
jgi:hypothetical protein